MPSDTHYGLSWNQYELNPMVFSIARIKFQHILLYSQQNNEPKSALIDSEKEAKNYVVDEVFWRASMTNLESFKHNKIQIM